MYEIMETRQQGGIASLKADNLNLEVLCARASQRALKNRNKITPKSKTLHEIHKMGIEILKNILGSEFNVVTKSTKYSNLIIYYQGKKTLVHLSCLSRSEPKWPTKEHWLNNPDVIFIYLDMRQLDKPYFGVLTKDQLTNEIAIWKADQYTNPDNRNDSEDEHFVGPWFNQVFKSEYRRTTEQLQHTFRSGI
jgi:hypothetical protein